MLKSHNQIHSHSQNYQKMKDMQFGHTLSLSTNWVCSTMVIWDSVHGRVSFSWSCLSRPFYPWSCILHIYTEQSKVLPILTLVMSNKEKTSIVFLYILCPQKTTTLSHLQETTILIGLVKNVLLMFQSRLISSYKWVYLQIHILVQRVTSHLIITIMVNLLLQDRKILHVVKVHQPLF